MKGVVLYYTITPHIDYWEKKGPENVCKNTRTNLLDVHTDGFKFLYLYR